MKFAPALTMLTLALGACATQPSPSSTAVPTPAPAVSPIAAAPITAAPAPVVVANPTVVAISTTPKPATMVAGVDFDTQIKPFIEEYCVRCHGGGPRVSGGINLTHKSGLQVATADKLMYEVLVSKGSDHMPPRSQEQPEADELAMIKQWIAEGAKVSDSYPHG